MLTNLYSGNGELALYPNAGGAVGAAAGARAHRRHRDILARFSGSIAWIRRRREGVLALCSVIASAFVISASVENAPPRRRRDLGLAWFKNSQAE